MLAIGTDIGDIYLWDIRAQTMRALLDGHSGRINALAAFPRQAALVSGGRDRQLKLWHTPSGEPLTTLIGHARQIFSIAISPDEKVIASGGLEGDIRLWRASPR